MWMPTHVQVTVQRAVGLLTKGKHNKNDCFVTIALGKTKYQTSIKEKASPDVEWHEECELPIPDQGNTAEIVLTALHHNVLGVDEFLGRVAIPLNTLDTYERPRNKFYKLESKPGKSGKPAKERGQLEVKIGFTVKSGSLTDLSKKEKHRSSIGQLSHAAAQSIGGSLLSLGSAEKRKGIKKFAKSIGSKMHLKNGNRKKDSDGEENSSIGSVGSFQKRSTSISSGFDRFKSRQTREDADPGVVSDEDEFTFDDLSHKSSASSLNPPQQPASNENTGFEVNNSKTPPTKPPRFERTERETKSQQADEWESKLFGNKPKNLLKVPSENINRRSWDSTKLASQIEEEELETVIGGNNKENTVVEERREKEKDVIQPKVILRKGLPQSYRERIIIGGENEKHDLNLTNNRVSTDLLQKFEGKSREELIVLVCALQNDLEKQRKKNKDMEEYLDELLLRVMETTPRILQNPYVTCKFPL